MKSIDHQIYHINEDTIEARRFNPLTAFLVTAAGAAMLFANTALPALADNEKLSQWVLLLAVGVVATGATMLCYWLFGDSTAPYYKTRGERMVRYEFYYDRSDLPRVQRAVESGDFDALATIPRSSSSGVMVVLYKPRCGEIAAAQVLEYVPHEYRPVTEPRYFSQGQFTSTQALG